MIQVEQVYKNGLCCSCGLCSNYCPKKAISYEVDSLGFYKPCIDSVLCIDCGICTSHCPGGNDLKNYNSDAPIYRYGYSNDDEMHLNAASGGIVTELLSYLIQNKIVDYVTCVTNRENFNHPQQILTNDISLIRKCRTSKYCPVIWNDIIPQIEQCNGAVAVVGLPCQINSIKHYYSKKKNCNIRYYIALICNHTPSLYAADYLAYSVNPKGHLISIINRGGGFPGFMSFTVNNLMNQANCNDKSSSNKYQSSYRKTWGAGYGKYFKNLRCILCNDPFAKNADITIGDSYFLQNSDKLGTSFCMIRNTELNNILTDMSNEGIITIKDGPSEEVVKHFYSILFQREKDFVKYNRILTVSFHKTIKSHTKKYASDLSIKDIIRFWKYVFISKLGKYKFLWGYLAKKNNLNDIVTIKDL